MTRRKRKKEPPDLRLSPFDFPLDRSSPVDLANYLLISRFSLQPFHFHCSNLDYGFSALPNSSQLHFFSQPVVGFQRRLCWLRLRRLSTKIQMELCIPTSSVYDGLAGYRRGSSLASIMVSIFQFRGLRSAIVERRCQDGHIRSIRFASFRLLFLSQTQVCYHLPPFFLTIQLGCFRVLCSIVLWSIIYGCRVCWNGLPRFYWPWNSLRLSWLSGVEILDVAVISFSNLQIGLNPLCRSFLWKLAPPMDLFLIITGALLLCFNLLGACCLFWSLLSSMIINNGWCCMAVPRRQSTSCHDQYVHLLRLHLGMFNKPPHGGWLHNYMMPLCYSIPAVRVEIFLYWGLPSILRSLLLVRLYSPLPSAFWAGIRWAITQLWSLDLHLLWTVFPLWCVPSVSRMGNWGRLFAVCLDYARDNIGIFHSDYFEMLSPYLSLTASWLRLPWLLSHFWLLMSLAGAIWTVPFSVLFNLAWFDLIQHLLLLGAHSIPLLMFDGDDKAQGSKLSALTLSLWAQAGCISTHVFLVSLQLHMTETHTHRIRLVMSLLRFISEQAKARFGLHHSVLMGDYTPHYAHIFSIMFPSYGYILSCNCLLLSCLWWLLLGGGQIYFMVCYCPAYSWLCLSCRFCLVYNATRLQSKHVLMSSVLVLTFHLDCLLIWCLCWLTRLGLTIRKSLQLILGCVVGSSVAPLCGEQPRLIAPRYKLAFRLGSVMSTPFSEAFSVISLFALPQNPILLSQLCGIFWLQLGNCRLLLTCKHCFSLFNFRGTVQHTLMETLGPYQSYSFKFPLVYEDAMSETSSFNLRTRTVTTFKLGWYSDAGIRTSHCSHAQGPDRSIEAHGRVFETRSSLMVKGPFLLIFLLRMYCFHMTVLKRIKCITDDTVLFPSGCIASLVVSCTRYFVSDFEQHFRVLGPCLMALDQHLRMLGQAFARPYYNYCLFLASAVAMVSLPANFLLNCTIDALGWNDLFTSSEV